MGRNVLDNYYPLKRIVSLHGFRKIIWDQQSALQLGGHENCQNRSITLVSLLSRQASQDLKHMAGMEGAKVKLPSCERSGMDGKWREKPRVKANRADQSSGWAVVL